MRAVRMIVGIVIVTILLFNAYGLINYINGCKIEWMHLFNVGVKFIASVCVFLAFMWLGIYLLHLIYKNKKDE